MAWFKRRAAGRTNWPQRFAELAAASRVEFLADFYRRGCPPADAPLSRVPLAALDLETTGLDARRHEIVSIGIVPFDLERIRPGEGWYQVVRPRRGIAARSVTIHRITHAEVDQAPDLAEVVDKLLAALAGRVAVVHFHAIERRFLYRAFLRRFGEGLLFPLIDTLEIERRAARPRLVDLQRWFGRRPASLRLADSRRRYGLPAYTPHHALTDALATAELFQAQVARHGSPAEPVSQWWL